MIRLGLVCSTGGAVFSSAFHIMRNCGYDLRAAVVTDRACGVESVCAELEVPFIRLEEPRREAFSAKAAHWLYDEQNVDWTALFFARLVDKALYSRAPCVNFHPALLPAFPGFGALKGVLSSGAKFFGATAHLVDYSTDGGSILAQVVAPIRKGATLVDLERISFAQKLYLMLVICEWAGEGKLATMNDQGENNQWLTEKNYANPGLANINLERAFIRFVETEGIPWPQ
jgi:phosphoribosylglycinamide formyltransferase-1